MWGTPRYAVGDAIAHFRRRQGFQVIHPMGYDAFGLPAENNAIKTGEPPRVATERSIEVFRASSRSGDLRSTGREPATNQPEHGKMLDPVDLPAALRARARLPDRGGRPVVSERRDGARQRAGDRRPLRALLRHRGDPEKLEQWFFKITDYADRLLDDFDQLYPGPST